MLRVSDIKQYMYCPRVVYFTYVMPVEKKLTYKMEEGKLQHLRLEELETRRRLKRYRLEEGERRFRTYLRSERLGLEGVLDLHIVTPAGCYPVEFKHTLQRSALNHKYQLTAYALLAEEHYGRPARRAFVYWIVARRAQPVTWAHYLLAYFEMFWRDHERLAQTRQRVNRMPLGSGALAGAGFPIDREALARELGFDGITANSMDVSADRDWALDFLSAASLLMMHLSRLAEDWILYSSDEFGWLELSDGVTSGSSLMPQKKNPDSLELIRGKCGRVFGCFTSLFMTMKGLPLTYNRDMQEDKEPLFEAADQTAASLEMARAVVETARLRPEAARRAAAEGWLVATDLAEALARSGVPFHDAHRLVGRLVLESLRQGRQPQDWTGEELHAFDPRFTPEMARLLEPEEGLKTRAVPGGAAPQTVSAALEEARRRLESLS